MSALLVGGFRVGGVKCQPGPDPMDVDTWGENLIGFDPSRRG